MFICRNRNVFFHRQCFVNFVCCQWLHIGKQYSQKKKWTKNEISSLVAWKYETNAIYGPPVDSKKARSSSSTGKSKTIQVINTDHCKPDYSQLTDAFTASHDETYMDNLPCSVSRHVSSQTVLEDPTETLASPVVTDLSNSGKTDMKVSVKTGTKVSNSSKHKTDDSVFDSRKRDGTYGYTWVDSPPHPLPAEKGGSEGNARSSSVQTTNSGNVIRNSEQIDHDVDGTINVSSDKCGISDADGDQSLEKSPDTELQTDKDESQNISADQNDTLSFPLFACSPLPSDTGMLSARFPSVSAILKATMSPESQLALSRWEQRMVAELGEDGFKEYQRAIFTNGSNLHAAIHQFLSGKPEEELVLLPANHGHWQSIQSVLADVTDVACLEKFIRHSHLQYCGVVDCVAEYRGEKYVIEWKTSKRRKSSIQDTFDNPLQLVAYLGAYNVQPSTSLQVERCLLVIGYEDGNAADVHVMDKWHCLRYWSNWLQRLHLYRANTVSST